MSQVTPTMATSRPSRLDRRFTVAEDGRWTEPRVVVVLAGQNASPDGMCVDADGGMWVAMWGAGQVQRWSTDGALTHVFDLTVTQPTSVALGGDDLRSLLITTSAYELPAGHGTPAGALFVARVDTPGVSGPSVGAHTAWRTRQ